MKKRNSIIAILLIEIIFLLIFLVADLHYKYDYAADASAFSTDDTCIFTRFDSLKRGIYTVDVQYDTNIGSLLSDTVSSERDIIWECESEEAILSKGQNHTSYRAYVNWRNTDVKVRVFAKDENGYKDRKDTSVNSISMKYNAGMSASYDILRLILLFIIIDVCIFLSAGILHAPSKQNRVLICFISIVTIVSLIPLYIGNQIWGHDVIFHLHRISGISESLLQGQFPVRIQSSWGNDHGFPVSVMYGDILLYIPALLYMAGVKLQTTYKLFLMLMSAATAYVSFYSFEKIFKDRTVGMITSAFYTLSIWRLIDMFFRAAVGEHGAMLFIPVIALGCYYLTIQDEKKAVLSFVIGVTGLINTHIISLFLVVLTLIVFLLVNIRSLFNTSTLRICIKSVLLTALLNAFFVVPFSDYYLTFPMEARKKMEYELQESGLRLFDFFRTTSEDLSIGILTLAVLLIALSGLICSYWKNKKVITKLSLSLLISLFLSTTYMPYDLIQKYLSPFYKVYECIQFPWRILVISTILATLLLGTMLKELSESKEKTLPIIAIVIFSLTLLQAIYWQNSYTIIFFDKVETYYDSASIDQFRGYSLYTPFDLDMDSYTKKSEIIGEEGISFELKSRDGFRFDLVVQNSSDKEAMLTLPVTAFKGIKAIGDNGTKFATSTGENSCLNITIPSGYEGNVITAFSEPWYWRFAEIISVLTLAFMIIGSSRNRRILCFPQKQSAQE